MIILGINWEQNSSASLMIDGKIVGCSSEERFSGIKNDERYPYQAINWLLKKFEIKKSLIDEVAFISTVWAPGYILTRHYTNFSINDYVEEQKKIWYPRIYQKKSVSMMKVFDHKIDSEQFPGTNFWKPIIKKYKMQSDHVSNRNLIKDGQIIRSNVVRKHLGKNLPFKVSFIDHSLGHAAYAYFGSKETSKKRLILTIDAFGDYLNYTARVFKKTNKKYKILNICKGSNFIIGKLYRYITLILGLKPNEHEYKVMGLAPYCKPEYYKDTLNIFRKFQKVKGLKFIDLKRPKYLYFGVKNLIDTKRFDAIAGGLQAYTEELVSNWVLNCIKKTGVKNICLAGGVALNVKSNYLISKLLNVKSIHIPPSPDDSSQSMGACFAAYLSYYNKNSALPKPKHLTDSYLGYDIKDDEIIKKINLLKSKRYILKKGNINKIAANLLFSGKIIGRVVGRAEFGARSLGNRSILADPSNPEIKKIINEKVKNRDFWMPFAASVLEKYAAKYFRLNSEPDSYSFMTNCVECTDLGKKSLEAAIHPYDMTCRPQILNKGINLSYENLIKEFGKKSGIYGLLNTSFNFHGKPLVNNFRDAMDVFTKTDLDALIINNYILIKKKYIKLHLIKSRNMKTY